MHSLYSSYPRQLLELVVLDQARAPSAYLEERDSVSTREERRCVEIMRAAF